MPHAATQTDPIILALLPVGQVLEMKVLQHASASTQTEAPLLPLPVGPVQPKVVEARNRNVWSLEMDWFRQTPWSRMVLALLIETDCERTMKTTRDGWTVEQGKERSREVNACFTYNIYLITSDWGTESALWRRGGRLTRDIILLRAWVSTGTLDWLTLIGRLDEFVSTLDTDTAAKFVSQLCNAYDRLFPAMAASRQSAMHSRSCHKKKG
jgi:hypothetical protein